jgi:tetratricopeptide (TPR) repeat protein
MNTLVDVYRFRGKRAEAVETAERAARLSRLIYGENGRHPSSIRARAQYARALGDTGQFAEAVEELERTLDVAEEVFGSDGRTIAFHLNSLANFQIRLGRLEDAIASSTRGLAIIQQHAEPGSSTLGGFHSVAGNAFLLARRPAPAIDHLSKASDIATHAFGPTHANTLTVRGSLALATQWAGRPDDASREVDRALTDMRSGKPVGRLLYSAVAVNRLQGALDRAQALLDEVQGTADNDPLLQVQVLTELGLVSLARGDTPAALTHLQAAFARFDELKIEPTPARADMLIGLGRAWLASGDPAQAAQCLDEARRFWEAFDPGASEGREAARLLAAARGEDRQ